MLVERLQSRIQLVGNRVHGRLVAEMDALVRRGDLAQLGLDKQAAFLKAGAHVLLETGFRRVQHLNCTHPFFKAGQKARTLAVD